MVTIVSRMTDRLTAADAYRARKAIDGVAIRTPLVRSALSGQVGQDVLLKLETLQPTGAFKLRGAAYAISKLGDAEKHNGVVCCSTGNHGRAVAYAAALQGVRAVVCLSELVPDVKVAAIEAAGAEVRRAGKSQDEAAVEARRLVREEGLVEIPPFDHPDVIAGQATVGIELLEARPDLDTILVPMSGGGLISGIAMAAKAIKPSIRIVGISMQRGAAMAASLEAGRPVEVEEQPSLADSLGGGIGLDNAHTFHMCRELVDEVVLVSEQQIYKGMASLLMDDRLVAEGAAAVGHAAVIAGRVAIDGPTALVISGGNVDMQQIVAVATGKPAKAGELLVEPEL